MLIVGDVVHEIAWNVSPGGTFGSLIYWVTKLVAFVAIWAALYAVIAVIKFIIAHWIWFAIGILPSQFSEGLLEFLAEHNFSASIESMSETYDAIYSITNSINNDIPVYALALGESFNSSLGGIKDHWIVITEVHIDNVAKENICYFSSWGNNGYFNYDDSYSVPSFYFLNIK